MNGDMQQEFFGSLDEHWDDYPRQFRAARQEITEETIHDLRVAARRLQARLRILRALDSRPRLRKIWRFLGRQLDQLDDLHDTQVMLQEAAQRAESLPQLGRFRDYLEGQSDALAGTARREVLASKPSDLQQRLKRLRKVAKRHSKDEDLPGQVLHAVDGAHAKTVRAFAQLDATDPSTIHHVRIAFKQFRYMVEAMRPLLRNYPEAGLGRMHDYQDAMGKVHDTTVFLDALKEFEKGRSNARQAGTELFDPRPIEVFYQTRLEELIHAYFERKDELSSYWRPAPDQPFPWEKSHDSVHRAARHRGTTGQRKRRGAGQPAASHRRRTQEVQQDRPGAEGHGDPDRSDPDQSVPAGG
jgi:CHAD domain-containing protein